MLFTMVYKDVNLFIIHFELYTSYIIFIYINVCLDTLLTFNKMMMYNVQMAVQQKIRKKFLKYFFFIYNKNTICFLDISGNNN